MKRSLKTTYLYETKFLNLPVVGELLYRLEEFFYKRNLTEFIFVGKKENKERKHLIDLINHISNLVTVRSINLLEVLKKIKTKKVLDIEISNLFQLNTDQAYALMWSLVFCDFISGKSKRSLKGFIPENFPVQAVKLKSKTMKAWAKLIRKE